MSSFFRGSIFDRLIDPEPHINESSPSIKTLTRKELKESIHRELYWLLNTTCSFSQEELESEERSAFNYGVFDFSNFFPDSSDNRTKLSIMLKKVIESYEPRLSNIVVSVQEMNSRDDNFSLSLVIDAELILDHITEPITFIMAIN